MSTPFEELEYLSDYLPEEGESVIVTRRAGELVCESGPGGRYGDGLLDPELYGRLVQWNLRLSSLSVLPIWSSTDREEGSRGRWRRMDLDGPGPR